MERRPDRACGNEFYAVPFGPVIFMGMPRKQSAYSVLLEQFQVLGPFGFRKVEVIFIFVYVLAENGAVGKQENVAGALCGGEFLLEPLQLLRLLLLDTLIQQLSNPMKAHPLSLNE